MRFLIYIWCIVIILLTSDCSLIYYAKSKRLEAVADAYLKKNQYTNAIKYYEKAVHYRTDSILSIKLGNCYWLNRDFEKAEEVYSPFILKFINNQDAVKTYAQIAMTNENYVIAKKWWNIYHKLSGKSIDNFLIACDSASIWLYSIQDYQVFHLDKINSIYSEISPSFYNEGLVFASSRPGIFYEKESGSTGEPFFDLYKANSEDGIHFKSPVSFGISINSPEHETSACFDSLYSIMYYTRGESDTTDRLKIKILQSEKTTFGWSKPKQFVLNDSAASFGQPYMNKKGNVFVFASDMPGGFGGTDLYISFRNGNAWTKPENLGEVINTSENEYYPFINENGDLYFTSNGHPSIGGFDLFVAKFTKKGWVHVENLKAPINSPYDDLSLIISTDGKKGFFASNRRNSVGKEDIYLFEKK